MPAAWSDTELLQHKDFAEFTAADRRLARTVMARLAAQGPRRLSRRTRHSHRDGTASARRARRPARHGPGLAAHRRRAGRAPLARAARAAPARGAGVRRLGLDGALRADAAHVHAGVRGRAPPGRGVRVRHPPDARDRRAVGPRPRAGAGARLGRAGGLVGRHAHRRGAGHAQPRARPPDRPRRRGGGALRRLGPRRPGGAGRRDGAAVAHRAPAGVAQPAQGRDGLRAAGARAWSRRCRTSTGSWPGTRSLHWGNCRN